MRVLEHILLDLQAERQRRRLLWIVLLAIWFGLLVVVAIFSNVRPDIGRADATIWASIIIPSVCGLFLLGWSLLRWPWGWRSVPWVITGVTIATTLGVLATAQNGRTFYQIPLSYHFRCLVSSFMFVLWCVLLILFLEDRAQYWWTRHWTLLLGAIGCMALGGLQLLCAQRAWQHLTGMHLLPVGVAGGLAWMALRMGRWRRI